jgi:putative ABC transport system permease protein
MATALNVLGLSVAFAAFMIIMMQVDYDRSFDGSHPAGDRIFRVEHGSVNTNAWQAILSRPLAEAFMQSSPHIEGGTFMNMPNTMYFSVENDGVKNFFREDSWEVSAGFADVFTFDMVEGDGRALDVPDHTLIPLSLAHKLFGNQPATGRQLVTEDKPYTVGGVYRDFPRNSTTGNLIYRPIPHDQNLTNWGNWNYTVYIRVNAAENVEGLSENFKNTFDTSTLDEWARDLFSERDLRFTPLRETHYVTGVGYDLIPKSSRQTQYILFGIALAIIFIAGINYMNFSAAMAPKRIRSINTQKVLGGDTGAIRMALVMEAAIIALVSCLASLVLVYAAGMTPLRGLVDADISLWMHPGLVAVTVGLAVVTGVTAGLYPAFYMTSFQPALVLKGSFGLSPSGRRLRNMLIGVQFIASFSLIIGSSFMYLQSRFLHNTSLGYDKDYVIVTNMSSAIRKSRDAFADEVSKFAGVAGVTYSTFLLSSADDYMSWGRDYHDKNISYYCLPVEPNFLDVMGVAVSEGRNFRPEDANTRYGAYVFNEKARSMFELQQGDNIDSAVIAGFMPDIKFASLRVEVAPMAFYVWGTDNWGMTPNHAYIKVKAGSNMREAIAHVRNSLHTFDDEYPFNVRLFDEVLDNTYKKEQGLATLISLFSLVAILISIVGVFGLVVFESEYRRKEISLRKVFGSTTGEILVMFNKTYMRILCICFVIAAPVAWYVVDLWLENFAYRTPMHWWVYAAAFATVSALTAAVVTFQSRNAANANPAEAIKSE